MSSTIPRKSTAKPQPRPTQHNGRNGRRQGPGLKHVITFAVAAAADGVQISFPPLWLPVSLVTALIFVALWGWRWEILCALVPELAPMLGILPSWVAIAIYLTARDGAVTPGSANDRSQS